MFRYSVLCSMCVQVTDESEMALYRKKLLDWEAEQCRQEVEFTITEEDLLADQRFDNAADDVLPDIEGRPRSGQLRSLEDGVQAVSDENLSHYMASAYLFYPVFPSVFTGNKLQILRAVLIVEI